MQITHLGHACLLVEMAGRRILIDPGAFSPDLDAHRGLDAIVITHSHPDHLDRERLPGIVAANPHAQVLSDPDSLEVLAGLDIEAAGHPDGGTDLGAVRIEPVGTLHALIHEDLPRITNVGVRLAAPDEPTLFHPGDALDADPGEIDILAFPLSAPWQRSRDMTAFLRRINPPIAIPIHDALLSDTGRALYLSQAESLGGADTTVRDIKGAGRVDFG